METGLFGAVLSQFLRDGDVVLLSGDMGYGKSEIARGIARGLGVRDHVPSPTFTILNLYRQGRLPLYHFDWYRIGSPDELAESWLDEMIGAEGITLIEWHEKAAEYLPERCLELVLEPDGDKRTITLYPRGGFELPMDAVLAAYQEELKARNLHADSCD